MHELGKYHWIVRRNGSRVGSWLTGAGEREGRNQAEPPRDYSRYDRRYVQLRQEEASGWVDVDSPNYASHFDGLGERQGED